MASMETLNDALADEHQGETVAQQFERFIRSYYLEVPADLTDAVDAVANAEEEGTDLSELTYLIGNDDLIAAEEYAQGLLS